MTAKTKLLRTVVPDAVRSVRKRARRTLVRLRLKLTGADQNTRLQAERMLRGRERFDTLQKADAVIVSYPKCGRTWLRVMISRLFQQIYNLPEDVVVDFDNFHLMDRRIPKILFTHDDFIREYTGNLQTKADYYDKKVILLVRDPRDVAVSLFFHRRYRSDPWKNDMNGFPPQEHMETVFDFVQHEGGLPRIIDFMNLWARDRENVRDLMLLAYENMRADPSTALTEVARFLDLPATEEQIREAVAYASFENMKKKEADQAFGMSGNRLAPGDKDNPDSYKVRRAKVGGYRDYFDDAQIATIDRLIAERLDPVYGYARS
ncbi:MAG: sulfotransferase domain-containing protein [Roseovarius sp.]|nr:sulfotransferase domain-containing protein [Roseovarius sp.]